MGSGAVAGPRGFEQNVSHALGWARLDSGSMDTGPLCAPSFSHILVVRYIDGVSLGVRWDSNSSSHLAVLSTSLSGLGLREGSLSTWNPEGVVNYPLASSNAQHGSLSHSTAVPSHLLRSQRAPIDAGVFDRDVPSRFPVGDLEERQSWDSHCPPSPVGLHPRTEVGRSGRVLTPGARRGGLRSGTCGPGHPIPPMGSKLG